MYKVGLRIIKSGEMLRSKVNADTLLVVASICLFDLQNISISLTIFSVFSGELLLHYTNYIHFESTDKFFFRS
jgi:hypothetical protein